MVDDRFNVPHSAMQAENLPTSEGTIEAMLFELRQGFSCLSNPANIARLKRCDKVAMKVIARRLLQPCWDYHGRYKMRGWSEDDVVKLMKIREKLGW